MSIGFIAIETINVTLIIPCNPLFALIKVIKYGLSI